MFMIPSLVAVAVAFVGIGWHGSHAYGGLVGRIDTTTEAIDFGRNLVSALAYICVLVTAAHSLAV